MAFEKAVSIMRQNLCLRGALAVIVLLASSPAYAEPRNFTLDPDHLTVAFLVRHLGFAKVLGVFREVKGTVVFDEAVPDVQKIEVSVATKSVDTGHRARDNHLRSGDFLDSNRHPQMVFTMTGAEKTGARTGKVTGNLSLRGQSHPLVLDVVWNDAAAYPFGDRHYAVGISARGALKRSLWGMNYGVADGLVGDDVEILIEAELIRGN